MYASICWIIKGNLIMKILFLGRLFYEYDEERILKDSNSGVPNACNIYQWNIIEGLRENNCDVTIFNTLPVGNFPQHYRRLIINSKELNYDNKEIGFINFYFLKDITRKVKFKKEIKKWLKKNRKEEVCIIVYDLYTVFMECVLEIKKEIAEIVIILIVTDLPNEFGHANLRGVKGYFLKKNGKLQLKIANKFDGFVLLTKQMINPLNLKNKEYKVIEGIARVDEFGMNIDINKTMKEKIIMYAGALDYEYNIENLIKAFMYIKDPNFKLWLCGKGNLEKRIAEYCKMDNRIKFLGYVEKTKIKELEKRITLYVNPRTSSGEYTKYSFPSKIIECLLSGKPLLMFKLPGVPKEYDKFVYYFTSENYQSMSKQLEKICNKNTTELINDGKKAREFVVKQKSSLLQTKKILNMIDRCKNYESTMG